MSFLDAFIGGAAQAGAGIIEKAMQNDAMLENQKALEQMRTNDAIQREQAVLAIKQSFAQKNASDMMDRVNQNAEQAGQSWYDKQNFGDPDTGGETPLSDDQQSVISQAMTKRQNDLDSVINSYKNNPRSMIQASVELGQESPDRLMTFDQKEQDIANRSAMADAQLQRADAAVRSAQDKGQYLQDKSEHQRQIDDLRKQLGMNTMSEGDRKANTALLNDSARQISKQVDVVRKLLDKKPDGRGSRGAAELSEWQSSYDQEKSYLDDLRKTHEGYVGLFKSNPKQDQQSSSASGQKYPDGTILRKGNDSYIVRNGVPVKL